jgi:CheY-like chemotaxis protein
MNKPILIVEDDSEIRCTLCQVLEDEGYAALSAQNGREALALLREGVEPGVVLLDLNMPEMDGWSFLAEVRENVPIIILSGHVRDAKTMAAASMIRRPAGFMTKPVRLATVLEVARSYCQDHPVDRKATN